MDTFEGKVYTINTSLNERTIYLKIIDTIQYLHYEGNIELKEFRMPITLQDAYMLVTNCFSETKDHSVSFSKNINVLRLDFKAKVGGYMNIGFEIILRESAIGGDGKASMQLIEMDRKHKKEIGDIMERLDKMEKGFDTKIESLESIIENQQNMIEIFGNLPFCGIPINTTDIDVYPNVLQFPIYYNCKKATIRGDSYENLLNYKNNSVEELTINRHFKSLVGLSNMPKLKILNIYFHPAISGGFLTNLIDILSSYTHTIILLNITQGIYKQDLSELHTYCKKNNIDLIVQ